MSDKNVSVIQYQARKAARNFLHNTDVANIERELAKMLYRIDEQHREEIRRLKLEIHALTK